MMDTHKRLVKRRSVLLRRIAAAARKKDLAGVRSLGKQMEFLDGLIDRYEELNRAVRTLESGRVSPGGTTSAPTEELTPETGLDPRVAGRVRGAWRKAEFVRRLPPKARPAQPITGNTFRARAGLRIALAYAHEGRRRDQWLLGLPPGGFDHAILLCESQEGKVTHLSLPQKFFTRYRGALTRNSGRVKLNVRRRAGRFFLLLPHVGPLSLEEYRDNYYGLR